MLETEDQTEKSASAVPGRQPWDRLLRVAKPYCPSETILFLFIWLILLGVGASRLFRDPGALWHPVVGQRILDSRQLIHTDPFSFTRAGEPWIAQWWLGDCILAILHTLGGLDTILLATATLIASLYTWIAHRLIARGLHPLLAALVTSLACLASSYHFHPRPHLATLAFMAVTFAWLCDFEAGRIQLRRLLWLVPLFVVWTNIHGGMVGGVVTLALVVFGWCITGLIGLESPIKRLGHAVLLTALVVACGLTALLNPYGIDLPRAWISLMFSPLLPKLMDEHRPLLATNAGYTVIVCAIVYIVALIGVLPKRPRVTWLIPLVWFCLAVTRVRHGPLFAVTAAIALGDMLPHIRWLAWLSRHGSVTCRLRPPIPAGGSLTARLRPAILPTLLILFALVLQVSGTRFPLLGAGRARPDANEAPVALLPELQELARGRPAGTPIFNDMAFGGFLIYYTPDLRVFIDDRCELYVGDEPSDEGLLGAYAQAYRGDPAQLDRWQQQYQFDLALVETDKGFDRYLQEHPADWTVVRRTGPATLYRRISP